LLFPLNCRMLFQVYNRQSGCINHFHHSRNI
jgi:hypothetical protein